MSARHNSRERPRCLKHTREDVLLDIRRWADESPPPPAPPAKDGTANIEPPLPSATPGPPVFWLNGFGGAGKSTIAMTMCVEWAAKEDILGAAFFCSRDDTPCKDVKYIIPTIAYQLQLRIAPFRDSLAHTLKKKPLGIEADFEAQIKELLLGPLAAAKSSMPTYIVVIDALDECEGGGATSRFLDTLLRNVEKLEPLRFFISSRLENPVHSVFHNRTLPPALWKQHTLHNILTSTVDTDITLYLRDSLSAVRRNQELPDTWPSDDTILELARRCQGSFIYAATAIRFVEDRRFLDPVGRLGKLMGPMTDQPSGHLLDTFYRELLRYTFPDISPGRSARLRHILGSIVVLQTPLSIEDLASFIDVDWTLINNQCIRPLRSVIALPKLDAQDNASTEANARTVVQFIHPTFPQFLLSSTEGSGMAAFSIDGPAQHEVLLRRCLAILADHIEEDAVLNLKISVRLLVYTGQYWAYHFAHARISSDFPFDQIRELAATFMPRHAKSSATPGLRLMAERYMAAHAQAKVSRSSI